MSDQEWLEVIEELDNADVPTEDRMLLPPGVDFIEYLNESLKNNATK